LATSSLTFGLGQLGDLAHAGQLHGLGDAGGAAVERATEDVGEAQDVVDLVRVVAERPVAIDAVGPHLARQLGADFRLGLASARMMGLAAMLATISGFSTPAAEQPRNTSAPPMASASVRAAVSWA
jgi:hypothetical protein